jgi:hypothetical protein
MQRWLAFMETKSKDSLLRRWGGEWDFLGDWLWPGAHGVNGDTPETLCFNNCYWAYALATTAQIAEILGEKQAAEKYHSRAAQVRSAINARFFRPQSHDYADGDQQYQAMALLAGVPTETERAAVWHRLEEEILVHRDGHIHAGITGGAVLSRALLDGDRPDLLYAMARQEDYPGWGDFLKKGLTTFPEQWDIGGSELHSSYLFIGAWFIEGLAGITQAPGQAGYQNLVIRPMIDAKPALDHASATYDSLYGRVACSWTKSGGKTFVSVTVPPNSRATLLLPAISPESIHESGLTIDKARGVRLLKSEEGRVHLALQSGDYRFEMQ